MTRNSEKCFTSRICWLWRTNALFGKGHLVNKDLIFKMSNILRGQILQKPSAWQWPTQQLKSCINQLVPYYSYLIFVHQGCQKGKWHFFAFFLSSCNLSLVSWYLGSAVDKLVKIQRRETCTETEKKSLSSSSSK